MALWVHLRIVRHDRSGAIDYKPAFTRPRCSKRAAREGLGVAFLSRYAVAEEVERGELESFRLAGRPPIKRKLYVARLARRPFSPSERGFIATLTRCCEKSADFAAACVA